MVSTVCHKEGLRRRSSSSGGRVGNECGRGGAGRGGRVSEAPTPRGREEGISKAWGSGQGGEGGNKARLHHREAEREEGSGVGRQQLASQNQNRE